MNSHLTEHVTGENSMDVLHSVEFFIAAAVAISVLGLLFFAAV